ncbi:MAG: hypothetical protein FWC96_06735 [Oscillospiraceae bacterium]|nr:hypothetical protein [Oscillospiraceae bacterium]
MPKTKELLPEDTVIAWNNGPLDEYRRFFRQSTGNDEIKAGKNEFNTWLFMQTGKTLKEALDEYRNPSGQKDMKDILSERRFEIISKAAKTFIVAFDEAINALGYDYGGSIGSGYGWSLLMIIYGKTETKSRQCPARIYIGENWTALRFYLNNIDKHRAYVENAPEHVKEIFFGGQDCPCRPDCSAKAKKYTIGDKQFVKCTHADFRVTNPNVDKLPDYMGLLHEFYPVRKLKQIV